MVVIFFGHTLMKMASSTISLLPFVCRRDLLGVNGGVEGLNFSRYGPSDLASPNFGVFLMVAARRFFIAIFSSATSSIMVI